MTTQQAVTHVIGVVIGVAVFTILIVTNKVTTDVAIPIITGLVGTLTAPALAVKANATNAK